MTEQQQEGQACGQCGHPFDPHKVLATTGDPTEGGVILCQVKGCQCFATWDVPQLGSTRETIRVPDEAELVLLRELFQIEQGVEE